jgi:hypothetical protein
MFALRTRRIADSSFLAPKPRAAPTQPLHGAQKQQSPTLWAGLSR